MLPRFPGDSPRDLSRPLESIRILVDNRLAGQRLDVALATTLTWRSRSSLRRLLDAGLVQLDGQQAPASRRVRLGDTIVVAIPPAPTPAPRSDQPTAVAILYEDAWMVAVDKPPGMAVHPSGRHLDGTLLHELHRRYRRPDDPEHDVVPRLLHRIDLETSGLVAVGLDEQFHAQVRSQFEDRLVAKSYLAVVEGRPARDDGTIDAPIVPDKASAVRLKLKTGAPGEGLAAVTHFRVLRGNGARTLLEVRPETGRTHQIRVHMTAIGHSLVGDRVYRSQKRQHDALPPGAPPMPRQALHARALAFTHPSTQERLRLEAPLPADMAALLAWLRAGGAGRAR